MNSWCPPAESNCAPTDYESAALTRHELEGRIRGAFCVHRQIARNYYINRRSLPSGAVQAFCTFSGLLTPNPKNAIVAEKPGWRGLACSG